MWLVAVGSVGRMQLSAQANRRHRAAQAGLLAGSSRLQVGRWLHAAVQLPSKPRCAYPTLTEMRLPHAHRDALTPRSPVGSHPPAPPPRSGKEAEVAQLRQMLEGFQQKVHSLEVQNYSLAMHLRQATDGKDAMVAGGFNKNPDVF